MIFKGEFQGKTNKFLLSDISLKNYNPGMNIWDTSMLQNFNINIDRPIGKKLFQHCRGGRGEGGGIINLKVETELCHL